MRFDYYEETDSFYIALVRTLSLHSATITHDFFIDLDSEDRFMGVESIGASKHLRVSDPIATPPQFRWVVLSNGEVVKSSDDDLERLFVYRPNEDKVYMEFARGVAETTVDVVDGVRADIGADGRVVGLDIADASRTMNLAAIFADGTPEVEWVAYRGEPIVARVAT